MVKLEGYSSMGPFIIPSAIKTEFQGICAKEIDPETGKKKNMGTKVTELMVEEIKKYKPDFKVPQPNGNGETIV